MSVTAKTKRMDETAIKDRGETAIVFFNNYPVTNQVKQVYDSMIRLNKYMIKGNKDKDNNNN